MKRWPLIVSALLFAIMAAFRFLALKSGFVNDHFVYITGGRQMLFGEWPTRDWIDPGLPLMFAASAFAQKVFGPTLFAEAMLVSVAFGVAAACTAAGVRQLTASMALGLVAAIIEVAVFPLDPGGFVMVPLDPRQRTTPPGKVDEPLPVLTGVGLHELQP